MVVHVTMGATSAHIESKSDKLDMHAPKLGVLCARMRGRREADFQAEMVFGTLELGEEVLARAG